MRRTRGLVLAVVVLLLVGCDSVVNRSGTSTASRSADADPANGGAGGPPEPSGTTGPDESSNGGADGPVEGTPAGTEKPVRDADRACRDARLTIVLGADGWPKPADQHRLNSVARALADSLPFSEVNIELRAALAAWALAGEELSRAYATFDTATIARAKAALRTASTTLDTAATAAGNPACAQLTR